MLKRIFGILAEQATGDFYVSLILLPTTSPSISVTILNIMLAKMYLLYIYIVIFNLFC